MRGFLMRLGFVAGAFLFLVGATTVSGPITFGPEFTLSGGTADVTLPGYGYGCTLSNDGTSPNTVIDISPCTTADDSTSYPMIATGAVTKTTGAWTVGSGNGCLDTGAVAASTWYFLYQIQRSDTGVVDYLCTATYGAPTMPASYNRKRYIGAIKTDGSSNILAFTQIGNSFTWAAPVVDINNVHYSDSAAHTDTLTGVPAGYAVEAHFRVLCYSASVMSCLFSSLGEADTASGTAGDATIGNTDPSQSGFADVRLPTNAAAQIRHRASVTGYNVSLSTIGWRDPKVAWGH